MLVQASSHIQSRRRPLHLIFLADPTADLNHDPTDLIPFPGSLAAIQVQPNANGYDADDVSCGNLGLIIHIHGLGHSFSLDPSMKQPLFLHPRLDLRRHNLDTFAQICSLHRLQFPVNADLIQGTGFVRALPRAWSGRFKPTLHSPLPSNIKPPPSKHVVESPPTIGSELPTPRAGWPHCMHMCGESGNRIYFAFLSFH